MLQHKSRIFLSLSLSLSQRNKGQCDLYPKSSKASSQIIIIQNFS